MNLRDFAQGQECKIMLPGYPHNRETTVLCHWRSAGITGGAQKAPDVLGAWGCSDCHRVTEGAQLTSEERELDRSWVKTMFLEGVMKTQYALVRAGKLKW